MQPRTLESVLASLDSVYKPQVESIRQRQSLIPQQIQAEEQGLQAKQTQAFGDILGGARRRGLGFSGIPLGEQAKYTSTEFLPALARLKQSGREQAMSLEDAILGIQERRNSQGQNIFQFEQSLAEQRRQFDEQQKLAREQAAAAQRAAAASNGWMSALGGGGGSKPSLQGVPDNIVKQQAMADAGNLLSKDGTSAFLREVNAIYKSANYGNTYDQAKLELIRARKPNLFSNDGKLDMRRLAFLQGVYQ